MDTKYLFPILTESDKSYPVYVVTVGKEDTQLLTNRPLGTQHHQLHFTLSGTGRIKINNKFIDIKKNDIMYLKPGTPQYYYPTSDKWEVMWLTYVQNKAYDILQLDSGIYSTSTIEPFVNIISLMLKDIGTLHFSKNASILLYQLLIEIRENLNNTNYIKQRSKLLDAINYIERNYASPIEISHVAELSNMTPEHFCRLFKERYNMRPVEYIKKLRLQEAKNKLISNPAMSISEISESVGYNSPSYFIKLFKELEGTTPICFRNSILNLEPPPET